MILFSQQLEILINIYSKFDKTPGWQSIERANLFINTEKFSRKTVIDFKIIVLYVMTKFVPRNFTDLLEKLDAMNDKDILEAMRFKSVILAKQWHIEKDLKLIESSNKDTYKLLTDGDISIFGFYEYYKDTESDIKGRLATKKFQQIKTLVKFLKA